MSDTSLFSYSDYKDCLKARIQNSERWGIITQIAEAAGCQRSYLSQVLNGKAHLTPDHAHGIASYWRLDSAEKEYFLLLVEKARAAKPAYRTYLEERLSTLKRDHENISKRLKRPVFESGTKEILYFSAWYWSALHVLVCIPEFQTTSAIASRLQMPVDAAQNALETLAGFGFVRRDGGRWQFGSAELHLPSNSPLTSVHHGNWRQRAVLHAQTQSQESGVHYTMVQAMDQQAFEKIRADLLKFIDLSNATAGPSPSQKLVCIACDLFEA